MSNFRLLGEDEAAVRLDGLRREMESKLSSIGVAASIPGRTRPGVFPPLNVYDDGESYMIRAELPGVDPKAIDMTVAGDTFTLSGERVLPEIPEGNSYHRCERDAGRFRRALSLPDRIDNSKVVARCANGILEITLPRAEEAKSRKIAVIS